MSRQTIRLLPPLSTAVSAAARWLERAPVRSDPSAPATTVGTLPIGVPARVSRVVAERHVARRLMEMGVLPGTPVSVTRVAPLGDPLQLELRGYALSIRRREALAIEVEPMPSPHAAG